MVSRSVVQLFGKSIRDSQAALVEATVLLSSATRMAWLLGFGTRATSVGGPSIEPRVICKAKSKHRLVFLD